MRFKIFQYLGIFVIIAFSAISILLSIDANVIDINNKYSFLFNYSSYFEDRFFDLRMNMTLDQVFKESSSDSNNVNSKLELDDRIVLVQIDDISLQKIGRWPWSRTITSKLIDKLSEFDAKVIAFDIFFSEPEMACNADSPDKTLNQSIKNFSSKPGRKVILPYSVTKREDTLVDSDNYFKELPEVFLISSIDASVPQGYQLFDFLVEKKVFPIELLSNYDNYDYLRLGHIEAHGDGDGVFRQYPIVANVDSIYVPSFALAAYEQFSGDKASLIVSTDETIMKTKKGTMNLNYFGETKLRWLSKKENFRAISAVEILEAKKNDPKLLNQLKDKLIFVGSTAYGAFDLRNTPIDSMLPGVYFHMNAAKMMLDGKFFVPSHQSTAVSWKLLAWGSLLIIFIMIFENAILDFFAVFTIMGGLFLLDTYYYIPRGYNNRLFFCLYSILSCYSWTTFLHFYQSTKEKNKIRGTFSRYLAPSIVNDLLKNPDKVKLGGEKKNITVFFSDVRDFTNMSEKLTPEQLSLCLNKYMTMMTDTLFEHNGTLDKYIGDAMVAYWGAPVDLENHPYWAVKGAIAMIERLPAINEEFEKEGFPQFKHGIGLNTGECSVGNMGSNQIFSYTALGDNMNLGARLESLCKFYGVQLNVSEYTKNSIPPELQKEFIFRTLDKVKVKGKEKPVTIYEALHPSHPLYNEFDILADYESGFSFYLNSQFEKAYEIFRNLNKRFPEDPTFERMLQASKEFKETPPAHDWDGSYTHKNK